MIISPFFACSGMPSISMLTRSSAIQLLRAAAASGGLRSLSVAHQTATAVVDHVFELVPVVLEEALHRPGRSIAEGADGVALDTVGDVQQQCKLLATRLAGEHALEQAVHPAGTFAAGRTLAAGLRHIEA